MQGVGDNQLLTRNTQLFLNEIAAFHYISALGQIDLS